MKNTFPEHKIRNNYPQARQLKTAGKKLPKEGCAASDPMNKNDQELRTDSGLKRSRDEQKTK